MYYISMQLVKWVTGYGWLVGCFGLNRPLRQYFSLYQATLVMEKPFEVFILYMDMVASFGHVTKLI